MQNKLNIQPVLLQDHTILNVYGFSETFRGKPVEKIPSFCAFMKMYNLKRYVYKKSKDGNAILIAVDCEGRNHYAKERNFLMAYIKLVRNFNCSNHKN